MEADLGNEIQRCAKALALTLDSQLVIRYNSQGEILPGFLLLYSTVEIL